MKLIIKALMVTSVLTFAASANANLIINGSFEDSVVDSGQWNWFTADNVNGWEGSSIEVWDSYQNIASFDGDQHAELNADGNQGNVFSIFQNFATISGNSYDVSFAYAARTSNHEQFSYSIDNGSSTIDSMLFNNDLVNQWTFFETSFIANSAQSTITFTTVTPSTATVGNFLDDVAVVAANKLSSAEVTAPTTIAIIVAGLFGIMFARRKLS